jgi:HEAT repeat protein
MTRSFKLVTGTCVSLLALLGSAQAFAQARSANLRANLRANLTASATRHALSVSVSKGQLLVRACRSHRGCGTAGGKSLEVPHDVDVKRLSVERIELAGREQVALVSAPATAGAGRWMMLLAASTSGSAPEPLVVRSGFVDRPKGKLEGERKTAVLVRERGSDGEVLVLGRQYENAAVCGRPATMRARELNPKTMRFESSETRALSQAERNTAERVFAKRLDRKLSLDRPRLLHATVASSAVGRNRGGMTDRNLDTVWAENRPGTGSGEFIVMSSSEDVPILGFELALRPAEAAPPTEGSPPSSSAPSDGGPSGVAPRELFLVTRKSAFRVVLPEDAWLQAPGTAYEVTLPAPVQSDCVALVLDSAYKRADVSEPQVGIAELRALTPLDSAGTDYAELARTLDSESEARTARALLLRSGPAALKATIDAYPSLSAGGRALALDVIDAAECVDSASFFVARMLGKGHLGSFDPVTDRLALHAKDRLRLCRKSATSALLAAVKAEQGEQRVWVARQLAALAPPAAVPAIVPLLADDDDRVRRGLRASLAIAAAKRRALPAVLAELESKRFASHPLKTRIDLLRALGAGIAAFEPSKSALAGLLASDDSFRTRYLLLQPAAHLAKAGDPAALAFVRNSMRGEASTYLRAHAVAVSAGLAPLEADLGSVLSDKQPRVRQAALKALARDGVSVDAATEARVRQLLVGDKWTFVRVGAAEALGANKRNEQSDRALIGALEDDSAKVRRSVLRALGQRQSHVAAQEIHDVADNPKEVVSVRVAAIAALGALCRKDAAELLFKLALRTGAQQLPYDRPLGLAALAALGKIKPPDTGRRLAPLLTRDKRMPRLVRIIAKDVIAQPGSCH